MISLKYLIFFKIYFLTFFRNNALEYLCDDLSNESNNMALALQIINGSGKWQIYRVKKNAQLLLDIATENNNIPLMISLLSNKSFMKYYESFPNKRNIFFARLNRITPNYIKSYSHSIKFNNEIVKDSLVLNLKEKVFPNQKENIEGFSKNITLLLTHFSIEIDTNIKEKIKRIDSNDDDLKKNEEECLYLMKYKKNSKILFQNDNFILRAFRHLDLETVNIIKIFIFIYSLIKFPF